MNFQSGRCWPLVFEPCWQLCTNVWCWNGSRTGLSCALFFDITAAPFKWRNLNQAIWTPWCKILYQTGEEVNSKTDSLCYNHSMYWMYVCIERIELHSKTIVVSFQWSAFSHLNLSHWTRYHNHLSFCLWLRFNIIVTIRNVVLIMHGWILIIHKAPRLTQLDYLMKEWQKTNQNSSFRETFPSSQFKT